MQSRRAKEAESRWSVPIARGARHRLLLWIVTHCSRYTAARVHSLEILSKCLYDVADNHGGHAICGSFGQGGDDENCRNKICYSASNAQSRLSHVIPYGLENTMIENLLYKYHRHQCLLHSFTKSEAKSRGHTTVPTQTVRMSNNKILLLTGLAAIGAALPQAHTGLEWRACPELNEQIAEIYNPYPITTFDCANLEVPLDYDHPDTSEKIRLDLFRVNATKEPVLGSVLYNPGGPGGTGAENLPSDATDLHLNIGENYNLISWDPRGTGNTIPFNCSTDDVAAAGNARRDDSAYHTVPSSNVTQNFLDFAWEGAKQKAETCYATNNKTGQFIGTASVAHDMISIVDALGEDGLLRYYGWSYGSALGQYFAAMFPDRVDRMLLDGNVNPYTWQLGSRPELFEDVDKTFAAFIDECWKNGDDCALVPALNATCKSDIWDAMDASIAAVAQNTTTAAGFGAYIDFLAVIQGKLYLPKKWPDLAEDLASILTGTVKDSSQAPTKDAPKMYGHAQNAIDGIRCSDATFQVPDAEDYLPTLAQQLNHSKGFGVFYNAVWTCAAWKMPNKQQYRGDFKVKTRHPILMVNGEYDPTTPISGAYNASSAFEGSVVLAHSGYGHGIFPSPSKCVAEKIRQYFNHGDLPEKGTVCKPDFGPWELAEYYAANNISRPF